MPFRTFTESFVCLDSAAYIAGPQYRTVFNCDQPMQPDSCINMSMEKRKCLGCGGELVMAFRPSENGRIGPLAGNAKWRCSTCGQAFTAEELRADKRASLKAVGQAQ